MTDDRRKSAESARQARERRLAAALRANLRRRKAAAGKPSAPSADQVDTKDKPPQR